MAPKLVKQSTMFSEMKLNVNSICCQTVCQPQDAVSIMSVGYILFDSMFIVVLQYIGSNITLYTMENGIYI